MWKIVSLLAPKTKKRKLQLHKNGMIMTPEAELDWIASDFGGRYGVGICSTRNAQQEVISLQSTAEEITTAINTIPVRKAVPRGSAPPAA